MRAPKLRPWLHAAVLLAVAAACAPFGASSVAPTEPEPPDAGSKHPEDDGGGVVVIVDQDACADDCALVCLPGETSHVLRPTLVTSMNLGPFPRQPETSTPAEVLDDEGAGDGDESYLACTDPGGQPEEIRFALEAAAIPETERITRVLVHARARRLAQGKPGTGLALGLRHAPTLTTFRGDIQPIATRYALHTLELVTVPFVGRSGRPWERADLEPSRLALAFAPADSENPVRVTQAWVEVCTVPRK